MAKAEDYKCPCCGAAIAFDTKAQKLKCPSCGTEFEVADLQTYYTAIEDVPEDSMEWEASDGEELKEEEKQGLHSYLCNSCGGEIVTDANTVATTCPFCGSNMVLSDKVSGKLKPDLVVPFKYDKKAAKEALKNHYKGKKLLPRVFKDENHIDEIKGVYVPFWLFDASADGTASYRATRLRSWSDHDFEYTETQYFHVVRDGKMDFQAVPVDGSEKIANDLMESIEPFNLKDAVDFNTAYLAGYFADRYDVDVKSCEPRANERIKKSMEGELRRTVKGYATVNPTSQNVRLTGGRARYALLPVWLLTTRWKGETYTFAMNGQTGRFVGDLPSDEGLKAKYFIGGGAIGAAIALAIQAAIFFL
ncbi:MAG: hypothetical protein VZR02_02300 [Lachnospiraceae bacterium]|nr:hypothetical protein [Lachnospiraceae bacterium]